MEIESFRIHVEDSVLEDLNFRLKQTKLGNVSAFQVENKDYGQTLTRQEELLGYWQKEYDWRKVESELNQFKHFTTTVSDQTLHFIHERSRVPGAMPLLLIHGWPGSVYEFHKVIRPLVSPLKGRALRLKHAFHVVCPSIPGFGWSPSPTQPGFGAKQCAQLFHHLMLGLGYTQYGVQGGDWGALICKQMALQFPLHCVSMHLNLAFSSVVPTRMSQISTWRQALLAGSAVVDSSVVGNFTLTAKERQGLQSFAKFYSRGSGYYHLQSTKPHTPGFALSDSPSGLLAWISEKIDLWSDRPGLSNQDVITSVMIYWVTNTITSSMRFYAETTPDQFVREYLDVPTGFASFPKELGSLPKRYLELSMNLVHYSEFDAGGHFAAFEQPQLFVEDLRQFFHRAMPFERACALAKDRVLLKSLVLEKPETKMDLATKLLLFAPVLPLPAVAALSSYLLASKL